MTLPYDTAPHVTASGLYVPLKEYAEHAGTHPRTVKRWIAADELPDKYKNEAGEWMISIDAKRTPKSEVNSGTVITIGARPADRELEQAYTTPDVAFPNLDNWPTAMMPAEIAARLIGCPKRAIYAHQDYYGAVKHGENGALLVPLATVKRLRG